MNNKYFIRKDEIIEEMKKCYKIDSERGIAYLAKSMMKDITIDDKGMTFISNSWFKKIHPWLKIIEKDVQIQNL